MRCCAYKCNNQGNHFFPKEANRKKAWEKAINRRDFVATREARLCSAHFTPEDYRTKSCRGKVLLNKKLKDEAVPSVFTEQEVKIKKRGYEKFIASRHMKLQTPDNPLVIISSNKEQRTNEIEFVSIDDQPSLVQNDKFISNVAPSPPKITRNHAFYSAETFRNDDKGINFYTGLDSFNRFEFVFSTLKPEVKGLLLTKCGDLNIGLKDQFLLTLMKLRRNTEAYELARFFGVRQSCVSRIVVTWVNFMHHVWQKLDKKASQELINFKPHELSNLPFTRVMVKIPIQKSSSTRLPMVQKNSRGLPIGENAGKDAEAANRSSGDDVIANIVSSAHEKKSVPVKNSTILKRKSHAHTLKDSKHVRRVVTLTNTFKILQAPVHRVYVPLMSKIYFICLMLCNFIKGNVPNKD